MGLKVSFCDFIRHYVLRYAAYSYVQQNAFEYASELSISSLHCGMDKVILNEQEQEIYEDLFRRRDAKNSRKITRLL